MAVKRNSIMSAVVTRMQGILISAGYYSNLGSNVFEWRPKVVTEGGASYVPTEQTELPALHIRDTADETERADLSGNEDHTLAVEIEIAHEATATGVTMRKHIEDVRKAIGVDQSWSGLALHTDSAMTMETVRLQADRTFFRTLIRLRIAYTTSAFNES